MSHHIPATRPAAKRLRFVLFLLGLVVGSGACAGSLDEIKQRGVIRIGINTDAAPRTFYGKAGQLQGFDIDIGKRIAKKLGVSAVFVPTPVAGRLPSLKTDRTDISLGALTRTPDRETVIDFTIPLHTDVISVLTTDKLGATSWRQLNDPKITIVDVRGYASVPLIQKEFPKARLLLLDNDDQVIRSLVEGRADALVEDVAAFALLTKQHLSVRWRVLREPIRVGYCAIGLSKGNEELRMELNRILADMHKSGFIKYEWKKWYSWPMQGVIDVDAELARSRR